VNDQRAGEVVKAERLQPATSTTEIRLEAAAKTTAGPVVEDGINDAGEKRGEGRREAPAH
jgi:hypothetical protein